eukprot:TRINITY_DN1287_c0_g1_i9.p3 TRINITY_DN1287_c0_g1~~TRINITY_DN1287_c0_g1_i9.p3  ORF type:complete len:114 (+),score=37.29 TRINITY_DN1287_c0_g1_i9:90-431(+)
MFSLFVFWFVLFFFSFFFSFFFFFFFSSRRRHTRCREVSWARRCVQETALFSVIYGVSSGVCDDVCDDVFFDTYEYDVSFVNDASYGAIFLLFVSIFFLRLQPAQYSSKWPRQ